MSFRRQVHVIFNPNITPPDHINFSYCNVNYRIFLSTESVLCFNCGEFEHISRSCKKHKNSDEHSDENNDTTSNPLNPPPVFVHNKKSDPKHPPKRNQHLPILLPLRLRAPRLEDRTLAQASPRPVRLCWPPPDLPSGVR